MKYLLIAYLLLPYLCHASPESAPTACLEQFIDRVNELQGYRSILTKREFSLNGDARSNEKIELIYKKPNHIHYKYLNEGTSGIRNNGMTLEYDGSSKIKMQLGQAKGLGVLFQSTAKLVAGESISLVDREVLKDEILTINRAGFSFMSTLFKKHLDELKESAKSTKDNLVIEGDGCTLRYKNTSKETWTITLKPTDSIFDIEEKYGTLAYVIYLDNKDQFNSFYDLFHRKEPIDIKIAKHFTDFEIEIDDKTHLPKKVVILHDSKKLGEYTFLEISPIL